MNELPEDFSAECHEVIDFTPTILRGSHLVYVENGSTRSLAIERLLLGVVANARSMPGEQRWASVMDAIGCGSTVAKLLCEVAQVDPDEVRFHLDLGDDCPMCGSLMEDE